jgi:perosamine synthetase
MRLLRGQGMSQSSRYLFEEAGYNFRLSNLSASILSAQLARSSELIEKRMRVFQIYRNNLLINYSEPEPPKDSSISPWLFSIRVPEISILKKKRLADTLAQQGIQTRPIFYPLPSMPAFKAWANIEPMNITNAEVISNQGFSLPTFPTLTSKQILKICAIINAEL